MTKEQEHTKPYLISQYAERYGLTKIHTATDSFVPTCSIWETSKKGVYIADYAGSEDLEERKMLMLSQRKGDKYEALMISFDVLEDEKCFKYALEELDKQ